MIDIKGIEKHKVLFQLWKHSRVQGISFLGLPSREVNEETFKNIIEERIEDKISLYFDYLMGKVIKCNIEKNEFDPWVYDEANGEGAAERAIEYIKESGQ